jgi:hypothetical protein
MQRQLAKGIIEGSGAKYSTIFYITPAGSSSFTYWLVHLSNVYRAQDVMIELHWALANNFSHFLVKRHDRARDRYHSTGRTKAIVFSCTESVGLNLTHAVKTRAASSLGL